MTNSSDVSAPIFTDLHRSWGWIFGLGVLFLLLGFVGLGMVVGLTLVSMYFFSALLFISGITHAVDVFKHHAWRGIIGQALIAVLYIAGACVVFYDPFLASTLITGLLAGVLLVIGATRIIMAFALRGAKGWAWLLLAGITAIILGILIIIQWPISGLWVIGMFIAIDMIVNGWTYIFIGLSLR